MFTTEHGRAGFSALLQGLAPRGESPPVWVVRAVGASIALLLTGAITLAPVVSSAQVAIADVRSDADWIMAAQLSDGAIANYVDKQAVWPYLSNFAAMGLARAFEITGNKAYSEAAWRWLEWYQAHEDVKGFVFDYVVRNGVPVSTGQMDSTDAYAGTYLLATRSTYRVTADKNRLAKLKAGIVGAVTAIEATQDTDGLTWAKPSWRVKYLMDQAETYAGLIAAVDLAKALNDAALAQRAQADADRMKAGVETLWNPGAGAYDWAKHDSGVRVQTNWSYLYSDALQQVWAIAFGLVDPIRSGAILTRFAASQPAWPLPLSTALFSGGAKQTVGYWPVAGLAFANAAQPVAGAVQSIRSASITTKRAWPYTTGNAGQLISFEAYSPASSMIASLPASLLGAVGKLTSAVVTTAPPTTVAKSSGAVATTTAPKASAAPAPAKAAEAAPTTAAGSTPPTTTLLNVNLGLVQANLSATPNSLTLGVGVGPLPTIQVSIGGKP